VEGTRLTTKGKEHLAYNPRLRNPVDWRKVAALATFADIIVTPSYCSLLAAF
jgi:hypothetical protein